MLSLLFYSWLPAAILFVGVALLFRNLRGIVPLAIAIALQLASVALYESDWQRLEGQPDQLYAWIVPFGMAVLSIVLILFAFVRNLVTRNSREFNPDRQG